MTSIFLFGAGASYGSGPCRPRPPPLGGQLFAELREGAGVAATIGPELAALFGRDFEAGMDEFRRTRPEHVTDFLRDMARYFAGFAPLEGNLYQRLVHLLVSTRKHAVFATTNYDLLIEAAIVGQKRVVCYATSSTRPDVIPLLKIHGSCNFLPRHPEMVTGIVFRPAPGSPGILDGSDEVRVVDSVHEIYEFCNSSSAFGPTLAIYAPDKSVPYSSSFVKEIQDDWRAAIVKAARIYVIGLRVHTVDDHIWGPLAKTSAPLFYVGFEPEALATWAKENKRKRTHAIASTFEQALPIIARHFGGKIVA
jgi:hypothetical protein